MIISLILGALGGVYCVIATAAFNRVSIKFLVYIWYNRVILGFVIGIADNIILFKNKYGNPIIRGAVIGLILGIILIIIPGLAAISYLITGIIFGALFDLIATQMTPSQSE